MRFDIKRNQEYGHRVENREWATWPFALHPLQQITWMDQADTIHVLEKFGFDPVRLGKLLRLYQAWMKFALGEKNPKRFLFFDPKKGQAVVPLQSEGVKSRLARDSTRGQR